MKIELTTTKEFEVKYLEAHCHVRHWEDATVNGITDESGSLIPCRVGDTWSPLIDIDTGVILNWTKGITADVHFKICDSGQYSLLDDHKSVIKTIYDYVPSIMCPEGYGYGDYVIMKIDSEGKISNWSPSFDAFTE